MNKIILSPRELVLCKYVFNLDKSLIRKLNKHYLKVWTKKYLDTRLYIEGFNFQIYDSEINWTIVWTIARFEQQNHLNYGLSFRSFYDKEIDLFQYYVIIKPWLNKSV